MTPLCADLDDDGAHLRIVWPDGRDATIPAPALRDAARDAVSERARRDGAVAPAPRGLRIEAAHPVGGAGLNLWFSDGARRAIYPWAYLREIAESLEP